ncbi:MAG: tetratricopeptide repeat protein, partial [Candidatus Aminicenantes bacterium]|nr:tetratricopeptide repeat protein [Candidatus Aminicenantes bacterium]NIM84061.1 tetratricopeptide repeat protein [Candidatus Aminicenantes bacterium]NIN23525.1 tetratricopeptide repeat protein [Candidatus Aminicenantes bacterium]NIN47230.1 tetratricopeptide repeat protein [Candidatus Aminicenantes bacterium]NIN90156.1 tetratricopeptide repeat protein [Candidatus Aminicenantes bacterium]
GNPRLMEWLDVLVGQMEAAEVPQLLEAIGGKQEEFIRKHVIRELMQRGGDELALFLHWFSIYRRPVLKEGMRQVGENARLETWEKLLQEGTGLSLIEYDQARENYRVTPLLREELSAEIKDLQACHRAAFAYYQKICKDMESIEPVLVEEWIYHALGCGEEEVASEQGGRLVKHLGERLAFRESLRVGLWVLEEKNMEMSTANDAFLLSALAFTLYNLGDHRKAIEYFEQALTINRNVYGEAHPDIAADLNNLGSIWNNLGGHRKAIGYFEQALTIWKKVYGDKHTQVAIGLNNLGSARYALGDHRKAIEYYEQALSIDRNVYGEAHPDVARDLNNLGSTYLNLGQKEKAKAYLEKAYAIFEKFFGLEHPHTKATAGWLEKCK